MWSPCPASTWATVIAIVCELFSSLTCSVFFGCYKMLQLCLMISLLGAATLGSPIPNNPINATIFNIESFFEQSLGNLAGTLISHHKGNSTEHFQSPSGNIQAEVEPINLGLLQGIAFRPGNHQLIPEQETTLFNNATEEVDLIKVDLASSTTTTTTEASQDTLKAIPSTVVSGTSTSTTTVKVVTDSSSTTSATSTTTSTSTATPTKSVIIVTAVTEPASTVKVTAQDDISDKIKEVEAEPVILSSGV